MREKYCQMVERYFKWFISSGKTFKRAPQVLQTPILYFWKNNGDEEDPHFSPSRHC